MKNLIASLILVGLACTTALHAQAADPKTEMAAKVVKLQQGPELDRLISQLAGSTTQELIANWGPKLETNVPKTNQKKASEALNAELKKYADKHRNHNHNRRYRINRHDRRHRNNHHDRRHRINQYDNKHPRRY